MALIQDKNENKNDENDNEIVYRVCKQVKGFVGANDVIIFKNLIKAAKYNLIYFGGDVQDYPEEMHKSSTCKTYSKWNLIDTGKLLVKKLSKNCDHVANVIIIRADHFHLKTFANYSNFLHSNDFGAPINFKGMRKFSLNSIDDEISEENNDTLNEPKCWKHLKCLLENSKNALDYTLDFNLPMILCGFSKGCIVLNQLCNELELLREPEFIEFRQKVARLIYLDGGHCGTSNAWITREEVVDLIKYLNWTCYVYITPYNMTSRSIKSWAIKEHEIFIKLLEKCQVKFINKCYFAEDTDDFDLNKHFEILNEFEIY